MGISPQRQDTERVSSYRFRYTNASPCNASETRSACYTFTRVANIALESWNIHLGNHHRGQTWSACQATALDLGLSPQRQDTERMSSYRFRYNNASPCNASGTRSAYPTFTMVANISPGTPLGHHHRGKTWGACQATALDIPLPAHAMPVEQGALVPPPPG